jgi:2-polyprenyl-3-methyl-5-hydroxy-6-metoxy-1,4-benzoquinol methylase
MCIEKVAVRFPGRWQSGYARGKLRADPVYEAVWKLLRGSREPVLDVGCGIGLLPFYLRERGLTVPIRGVDVDEKKIALAKSIASDAYDGLEFIVGDVLSEDVTAFGGNIVVLDVLHYLPLEKQTALLARLAANAAPGALRIIRCTLRERGWRFRMTLLGEGLSRVCRWTRTHVTHYLARDEVLAPFVARGFSTEVRPMWGHTPFSSHLFVLRAP